MLLVIQTQLAVQTAAQSIQVIKVAGIFHVVITVREQIAVQIDDVIVRHAGDIVHDDLVWLGAFVWNWTGIVGLVYIIYVMAEDRRILFLKGFVLFIYFFL